MIGAENGQLTEAYIKRVSCRKGSAAGPANPTTPGVPLHPCRGGLYDSESRVECPLELQTWRRAHQRRPLESHGETRAGKRAQKLKSRLARLVRFNFANPDNASVDDTFRAVVGEGETSHLLSRS